MDYYVFATASCGTARADGVGVNLREGDVWSADDPLVIAKPGLFSKTPPGPAFPRRSEPAPVEEDAPDAPTGRRGRRS
jgi:hypothetical protein